MIEKEELKRMEERPGFNADGTPMKMGKRKRVKRVAQKVAGGVVRSLSVAWRDFHRGTSSVGSPRKPSMGRSRRRGRRRRG